MKRAGAILIIVIAIAVLIGGLILGGFGVWYTVGSLSPQNADNDFAGIGTALGIICMIGGLTLIVFGSVLVWSVRSPRAGKKRSEADRLTA